MKTVTKEKPKLIEGGNHNDARGTLLFVNDFDLSPVKRFYTIIHPEKETVRAWQGHKQEHKYFYVVKGSFVVAWVEIDNWEFPSKNLKADSAILTAREPKVLSIPPGYANGLKAIEADSQMIVFSDKNMQESSADNTRFDKNLWLDWNQF